MNNSLPTRAQIEAYERLIEEAICRGNQLPWGSIDREVKAGFLTINQARKLFSLEPLVEVGVVGVDA